MLYKYHNEKASDIDLDLPDLPMKQKNKQSQSKSFQHGTSDDNSGGFNPFAVTQYQDQRSKSSYDPDWANKYMERYQPGVLENGAKFLLAIEIIQQSIKVGDKILLFSQSLLSLDLIEKYLSKINVENTCEKWTKYKHYYSKDKKLLQ